MSERAAQRGGFFLGLIVGLLVGLGAALGVALYVTKVPVPFINKVPQRSAEQDAAQAERNRNWDPNAALSGKAAQRQAAAASGVVPGPSPAVPPPPDAAPSSARPVKAADPAGAARKDTRQPAPAASAPAGADPVTYFVQAGAYARAEDAEQQRGNLALMGLSARITEREQAGRTVYRVRLGPFERKDDADATKEKLDAAGIDAALVRVQR